MQKLITETSELKNFTTDKRIWQGIPSIEKTAGGRLFAAFYSGGIKEDYGNYCVLVVSDNDGQTWSEPVAAAYLGQSGRCYDPCLWIDPLSRLWFIWSVMPRHAVYASLCSAPDSDMLEWSDVFLIGHDTMLNKPVVLSSGDWLFPVAVWAADIRALPDLCSRQRKRLAFVYKTTDGGKTFTRLGGVDMPKRCFDEHMILEKRDGTLKMYVRTFYGIGESASYDGGLSWTKGKDSGLGGPCSRFFIRRLKSGNILLVNHVGFSGRNNLTALISRDDGKTFEGGLTLDERCEVSYPDGTEDDQGFIYVTYDRERGCFQQNLAGNQKCAREILFAKFTENDVLAGKTVTAGSKLKCIISKLGKYLGEDRNPYREYKYYSVEEYADILMEIGDGEKILAKLFRDYSNCCNMLNESQNKFVDGALSEFMTANAGSERKRALLLDVVKVFRGNAESSVATHILVENLTSYITENLTENLTVNRIADYFNISVYYMCHLFKSYTNTSIIQFINSKRISAAKKLLRETDMSITEICYAAGFGDSSYFTKQFRKTEGVSPLKYRKQSAVINGQGRKL